MSTRRALAALLALVASRARATETASFLTIGPGGRGIAMGSAYAALTDGADSLYWNPAGLARMEKAEVMADDAELPQSERINDVFVSSPTKHGSFAAGATYFSQAGIDGRNALGQPTGSFGASDGAGMLGWALKTNLVDFGASVKYIRSHIASTEASDFAFDLGAKRAIGPLELGATVRNLGPGMRFLSETDDLPLRLDFGAAWRFEGGHALTAEIDDGPHGAGWTEGVGGEAQALKGVFFRAGYASSSSISGGDGFNAISGLTFGFGLRQPRWSLDYAAEPMGELVSAQRFSAAYRW